VVRRGALYTLNPYTLRFNRGYFVEVPEPPRRLFFLFTLSRPGSVRPYQQSLNNLKGCLFALLLGVFTSGNSYPQVRERKGRVQGSERGDNHTTIQ
jgi:hypothetical protein